MGAAKLPLTRARSMSLPTETETGLPRGMGGRRAGQGMKKPRPQQGSKLWGGKSRQAQREARCLSGKRRAEMKRRGRNS